MASKYSKALPFLVLLIVISTIAAEVYYNTEIDLEEFIPVLTAIGVGGAAKSAIQHAAQVRKEIPQNIDDKIRQGLRRILTGDDKK